MAQRPPDVTPAIAQGDLTEDQLQHYLQQKEVAVDTETMGLDPRRDFPIPEGGRQARFGTSVTVIFTVTTDGRARECSVAQTTADAATTALVCGLVMDKIRFNPARNSAGDAVEARYGYRVDFRER